MFFFFKQKTAYEMRISDWSSDVCSSDLRPRDVPVGKAPGNERADAEMQRGIAHQTLDRTGCRARRGAQTERGIESCGLDADPGGRGGEPALGLPAIRPPPDQSWAIAGGDRPLARGFRGKVHKNTRR